MDSNVHTGTRDLTLSGSFVMPLGVVRLLGTDVPVIDRIRVCAGEPSMRVSAAEP